MFVQRKLIFLTLKRFQENFKILYGLVFQFVVSILSLLLLTIMSPDYGVVRCLSLLSLVSMTLTVLLVSVYRPELSNLGIFQTSRLEKSLLIHALNVYPFLTFRIFRCNLLRVCCPSGSTHPRPSLNAQCGHNSFHSQHPHCQSLFLPE